MAEKLDPRMAMVLYHLHKACEEAQLDQLKLAVECLGISQGKIDKIETVHKAYDYLCCQQSTASEAIPLLYAVLEEMDVQALELSKLKNFTTTKQLEACWKRKDFGFAKMIIKLCNEFGEEDFRDFRHLCLAKFDHTVTSDHYPTIVKLFQKLIRARKVVYPGSVQVLSEILTEMQKESSLEYVQEYKCMIGNVSQATEEEDLLNPCNSEEARIDKDGLETARTEDPCNSEEARIDKDGLETARTATNPARYPILESAKSYCVLTEQHYLAPHPVVSPHGTQAGCIRTDRVWDTSRICELKVHFMNPELLRAPGKAWRVGNEQLTTETVLAWATRGWNKSQSNYPQISEHPALNVDESQIRVAFGTTGVCWSCVGRDAENNQGKCTMYLNVYNMTQQDQLSLILHEFGHALGLEHEHQRSDFWEVLQNLLAYKPKKLPHACDEHLRFPFEEGVTRFQTEYDPNSIMHYWFSIDWLLPQYHNLEKVRAMTVQELPELERKVIEGVHLRDYNKGRMAKGPSQRDYDTLEGIYKHLKLAKKL